jgi:TonB family protein
MGQGDIMTCHQRLTLTAVFAASLTGVGWSGPRQPSLTEERLKQLVVMIEGSIDQQAFNGAGIIFGLQGSRLYVVTANHVVRLGAQQADQLKVQFKWLPGEWWDARVLEHVDRELDIAVLAVSRTEALDVPELSWVSLAPPDRLRQGDKVRPIGYARGVPWFTPQQRHLFHSATPLHIRSEGEFHPGNSGGPLVIENWAIVGIASQADSPYNRSSRIDRVVERLGEWGYHVNLAPLPADETRVLGEPPKLSYEAARVVKEVPPVYPPVAKTSRTEGTVELTCVVTPDGRPTEIKVLKSIDPMLDEAAIEALSQWEFLAATKFGEPVPSRMTVEITFGLK